MKTHIKTIAQCADVHTLKEEIAVLTRDLQHYQSRLRQLQQQFTADSAQAQQLGERREALRAQCRIMEI